MDIYQALKKDHRTAKSLFTKLLKTSMEDPARERILEKLKTILASHHDAEENVFYAALRQAEDPSQQIENALEQHEELMHSIEEIETINLHKEEWQEKVADLQEYLLEHIKIEEGTIFKEARQTFSDHQAKELAQDFINAKQ